MAHVEGSHRTLGSRQESTGPAGPGAGGRPLCPEPVGVLFLRESTFLARGSRHTGGWEAGSARQGCVCVLSCARLVVTSWTVARQAPLSMGFPRQEHWSRLPVPTPGDLPHPGIQRASLVAPALAGGFFTTLYLFTTSATWALGRRFSGPPPALGTRVSLMEELVPRCLCPEHLAVVGQELGWGLTRDKYEGAVRSSLASLRNTGRFSVSCAAPVVLLVDIKHAPQGFQRRAGGCPAPCRAPRFRASREGLARAGHWGEDGGLRAPG